MNGDQPASGYLAHLPAVWRSDPFAGRFLLAFEVVLSGRGGDTPGLEETIGDLARYLDPETTEPEFLPWLARWVVLSVHADWDVATRRKFIRQIVPLYRLRGTKEGLQRLLALYTGQPVEIHDDFEQPAHYFQVRLRLAAADPGLLRQRQRIARAIVDQEKPAHTFYALQIAVPTMRLVSQRLHEDTGWPRLFLGENTVLGTTVPKL